RSSRRNAAVRTFGTDGVGGFALAAATRTFGLTMLRVTAFAAVATLVTPSKRSANVVVREMLAVRISVEARVVARTLAKVSSKYTERPLVEDPEEAGPTTCRAAGARVSASPRMSDT